MNRTKWNKQRLHRVWFAYRVTLYFIFPIFRHSLTVVQAALSIEIQLEEEPASNGIWLSVSCHRYGVQHSKVIAIQTCSIVVDPKGNNRAPAEISCLDAMKAPLFVTGIPMRLAMHAGASLASIRTRSHQRVGDSGSSQNRFQNFGKERKIRVDVARCDKHERLDGVCTPTSLNYTPWLYSVIRALPRPRRNLTCEYNASFVTLNWRARQLLGGALPASAAADVFSCDFKKFSYRSSPIFLALCRPYNNVDVARFVRLLERRCDVLKRASSLDWRTTLAIWWAVSRLPSAQRTVEEKYFRTRRISTGFSAVSFHFPS